MPQDKQTKENKEVNLDAMSVQEQVKYFYEHGRGSIQDIARVLHVSVDEVLDITGNGEMKTVETTGDLVDAQEAGPGADISYGKQHYVQYSTD